MICERKWCDIIFFHPALPSLTHRIEPDPDFQAMLNEQLEKVIAERDQIMAILKSKAA